MEIERFFVLSRGLPGRPLIRNLLVSPSKYNTYGSTNLPGLRDALYEIIHEKDDNWEQFHQQLTFLISSIREVDASLKNSSLFMG